MTHDFDKFKQHKENKRRIAELIETTDLTPLDCAEIVILLKSKATILIVERQQTKRLRRRK